MIPLLLGLALNPISPQEWQARVAEYDARVATLEAPSADEHFALGQWAWESGLEDEAWDQWIAAIAADPRHAESRAAMGFERGPKKSWRRPGDLNPEWIASVREAGRSFSFTVAIQDDADAAFFEHLSWRFKRMSWFLWELTEGQVFLDEVTLEDQRPDGRFVIEAGKLETTLLQGGGAFCMNAGQEDWKVISAGRVYNRILVHEFLHGIFGLPDERHGCECIMQGGLYGIRTDQLALCDVDSHAANTVTPTACWTLVQKRYPAMKHPNPDDPGQVPKLEIKIVNH